MTRDEMRPYAPRPIHPAGLLEVDGWRLKRYAIAEPGMAVDWDAFGRGVAMALDRLPRPARAPGRPGVGFVVAHAARAAWYVTVAWWDRENELPVRVFVRAPEDEASWRPAVDGESFCVWELQVLWFEREAYVETMLDAATPAPVEAYLDEWLVVEPDPPA